MDLEKYKKAFTRAIKISMAGIRFSKLIKLKPRVATIQEHFEKTDGHHYKTKSNRYPLNSNLQELEVH